MRYRKLSTSGDYVFGGGQNDFYRDVPEAVSQAAMTRLRLWVGQWFIDTDAGTNWAGEVLGRGTAGTRDIEIADRLRGTAGCQDVASFTSAFNPSTRAYSISAVLNTIYGTAAVQETL